MADEPGAEQSPASPRRQRARRDADAAALRRIFDGDVDTAGSDGGSGAVTAGASRSADGATDAVVRQAVVAGIDAYAHAGAPGHDDTALQVPATVEAATRAPRQSSSDRLAAYDDEGDDADDVALAQLAVERSGVHPLRALRRSLGSGLGEAGEMSWLAASTVKSAVTRPRGYWGETREQIYSALKLCWVPMIVSITAFGIGAPGLQGGNVFSIFGVPEREGSFIVATGIREFAPWIDAMIIAGVVGTAITADIGARRIREEIDAMEVLGVDPLRELVVPRVLSTAIITGLFDIVALLVGILGGYIASVVLLGASSAGYVSQFFSQANVPDLLGSFVKTFLFGGIVGVVCCYKGLRASGGPAGVGKAVNQAVVISFALIWMVNYVFTNILLGFAPSTQAYH